MRNPAPLNLAPSILPPQLSAEHVEESLLQPSDTEHLASPSNPALHAYLGDVDDLAGSTPQLPAGSTCRMPLLQLDVVLMPGATLPLRVMFMSDRRLVEHALAAPAPLSRLLTVVFATQPMATIGCTAEIQQMRRQADGSIHCLAKGRQRVSIHFDTVAVDDLAKCRVAVLPEPGNAPLPREVRAGAAHWHAAALPMFDAADLADQARTLFRHFAPEVKEYRGSPLELSFWLSVNLPLQADTRQQLLECTTAAARLCCLIKSLQTLGSLRCVECGTQVAAAKDVISMSEEGIGSAYVNSHGFVHDMITLREACSLDCFGDDEPQTENSWFPGYGWTIMYCINCRIHMGWLFSATDPENEPRRFWGIRRCHISEAWEEEASMRGGLVQAYEDSFEDDGSFESFDSADEGT
ncbi:hypothetical protein WJX74_005119 [Apatococcus lobatus]|uniref:Protein cereblon n=2 Tax=Apatococcus TaxID=904362 RepID=A0AAW1SMX7_9CHLO